MNLSPGGEALDRELDQLGVVANTDTRRLLSLLATDPHALYTSLSRLSELQVLDESGLPQVDWLVEESLNTKFASCSEPFVLHKSKAMGLQCKRLLGLLLRDVGIPVPLPELLLANGLRSATPRRLRELETEHGCFAIQTFNRSKIQHYVLTSPDPDADACARYWIRSNLRSSDISPPRKVLALLTSEPGRPFKRRDLEHILPSKHQGGKGRARPTSGLLDNAVSELRQRGHDIAEDAGEFTLH